MRELEIDLHVFPLPDDEYQIVFPDNTFIFRPAIWMELSGLHRSGRKTVEVSVSDGSNRYGWWKIHWPGGMKQDFVLRSNVPENNNLLVLPDLFIGE